MSCRKTIKRTESDPQRYGKLAEGESEETLERFSLEKSAERIIGICSRVLEGEHV